jgi:hypothetical protein
MKTTIRLFLTLLCLAAITPTSQAVSPAPDGGYPGWNTAEGSGALFNVNVVIGTFNTAVGGHALYGDTTGRANTAVGAFALTAATSGNQNVAVGHAALRSNTVGNGNTAVGFQAAKLMGGPSNDNNTAIGFAALDRLTHGNSNTAIGANALDAISGGSQNIAVGSFAGGFLNSGNYNIDIGSVGVTGDSNTIRVGDSNQTRTFVAGINGVVVSGAGVIVNADGQLGVAGSSARFKEEIKPMDKASEAILGLKPVSFRYKRKIDPNRIAQFGLIAEEVEKINSDLIVHDPDGKPYSVRYDAVNAMLLNEFLKEHREVAELKSTVAEQRKSMEAMAAQLKEQAAQIQKVSAQLEVNKPALQTVLNNQ